MHFTYCEYVQFCAPFRYMDVHLCVCVVAHVCAGQYHPHK